MKKPTKDYNRIMDKIKLTHRVNYLSSALMLLFYPISLFLLDIGQPIPYIFLAFGLLNIINTLIFKLHNNLILTYNITSVLATVGTVLITLYSGGISSPFIFVLGIIVFAAYATTRRYGKVYLYLNLLIIILIYVLSSSNYAITENVVPLANRGLFALFCILFSVYMIGGVFGKFLLKAHHRLYKTKREIEDRISEKETLLREVHHRVKNNLQTVSSLLSLQSRSIEDKKIKSLIKSSQNRVISMAMVHEMLYMRDDYLSKIEYKTYVHELSQYLVRSVKGNKNNVKLNIDIADIKLGIDTAIPLGLLINEAITNALKYGIKDDTEGIIHIELKQENEKGFILNIGDNGDGFSESITPQTSKSLGLKLIHNLARQLKGSITKDLSLKGTNYIIRFQEVTQEFNSVA